VDKNIGTGAVKITPSHSFEDYDCGKRNNLEFINILNQNGTLNENTGKFNGIDRFDARELIINELVNLNLYIGSVSHEMFLPVCERSKGFLKFLFKDIIEPLIIPQVYFFIKDIVVYKM
jgi:valyl-tRNA synthetase